MMRRLLCGLILLSVLVPTTVLGGPLQRFALVVGANKGGGDRRTLKYAVTDAERFERVMVDLGGVSPENAIVLKEPHVRDVLAAFDVVHARLTTARRETAAAGGRTELFFYYSGHADEKGLLLGEDRLSYQSLRDRLDEIAADVRIAVLDACASGAFTRLKGGKARPPFLVDDATAMRGHAFLTSSAETEAAQESDRIRASYFSHFLVSGFRGAADSSGDGRVTLNEAYQFAFTETLGRTVDSAAGAQHPSYEINLSGTGDVVMTDVRQTTAALVLGDALEGRLFVRIAGTREPVVELAKSRGRTVEIGVPPGSYDVRIERDKSALVAKASVPDGARVVLTGSEFIATAVETTRRRGDGEDTGPYSVIGRNRLTLQSGLWSGNGGSLEVAGHGVEVFGGLQFARYFREDLALTIGMSIFGADSQVENVGGLAVPIGVQWNPRGGDRGRQRFKPFVAGGLVPLTSSDLGEGRRTTVGANAGAGFDFHVAPTLALGVNAGYNVIPALARPMVLRGDRLTIVTSTDIFSGPELSLRIGWLFGGR
jgi:hypothetical protein